MGILKDKRRATWDVTKPARRCFLHFGRSERIQLRRGHGLGSLLSFPSMMPR